MSEAGVSRRSILRGAAVTAAAGVAGYAVAARSDAAGTRSATAAANSYGTQGGAGTRLAAVGDIPPGGGLIIDSLPLVLTRTEADEVRAFSGTCTHQGCPVQAIEGNEIVCPCHQSRFDLETGEPVSGPARRPLSPIAVEVRGEDIFAV